jgi:hypothetical protein
MLLTPQDLFAHFPEDSAENLELKITQATSLISSYLVANRDFKIKKYIEIKPLNYSGNFLLSYLPILNDSVNYAITVETRNRYQPGWTTVDDFSVDFELGEIMINQNSVETWSSIWNAPRSVNFRNERGSGRNTNQVKITYFSGVSFDSLENYENNLEFKNNLINLIKFQSSDSNAGLKRFKLEDHYEVEYLNAQDRVASSKNSTTLNDFLAYFKKFKPRTFSN